VSRVNGHDQPDGWLRKKAVPPVSQQSLYHSPTELYLHASAVRTARAVPMQRSAQGTRTGSPAAVLHWVAPVAQTGVVAGYVAAFAVLLWPLGPVALLLGLRAHRQSAPEDMHAHALANFAVVVGSVTTVASLWLTAALLLG